MYGPVCTRVRVRAHAALVFLTPSGMVLGDGGSSLHSGIEFGRVGGVGPERVFGGMGVRSGPGAARTILLFHIISARPSKQPLMVHTFLKVYMELGSYF